MQDDGERLRWGVRRRLEFIDFRLFWDGRFNRSDMAQTFGISAQQASADIAQYERIAPKNLAYDRAEKAYRRTEDFAPAFIGETIERYLLQLVAIENRWMRQEDTWFDVIPPVEVITLGRRPTDPTVLLHVLDAVRSRLEIDVDSTLPSPGHCSNPEPSLRIRSPTVQDDGTCDPGRASTTTFAITTSIRIITVGGYRASTVDPALDFEWIHKINLVIVPNPGLSLERQAAVAAEHAMEDGRRVRPCRLSLSFYLMSEYNLDVEPGVLKPEKQQIILQNCDEVTQARSAARQMAIEALARAQASGSIA